MPDTTLILQHMEVVGSCGGHVGFVDHLDGPSIRLKRGGDGVARYLALAWVESVGQTVRLGVTRDEAVRLWQPGPAGAGGG